MSPVLATIFVALTPVVAVIGFTPDPIAFRLGPLPIYWYGIAYAVGLAAVYRVLILGARRWRYDTRHVDNGIVIVAIAALAGGRLYHVIDQWQLYANDPITAILPVTRGPDGSLQFAGISGLGVYGGIISGTIAAYLYTRWKRLPFLRWADIIAPSLFVMQAIGRWGNFFNQELYGPPTALPWGIAIDCAHRIAAYPCETFPVETTGFHPLFLYESVSGVIGFVTLWWLGRRHGHRLRAGDLFLIFVIWYAIVRFALEFLRSDNWTLAGIPTAQIISAIAIVAAGAALAYRHRPGAIDDDDLYDEDDDDEADDDEADDTADDDDELEAHDDAGEADDTDDVEPDDPGRDGPSDEPGPDADPDPRDPPPPSTR